MEKNFKDIFNGSEIELPEGLKGRILGRIENEKRKRQMRLKMLYFSGIFVSVLTLFGSVGYFGHEILASEFWQLTILGLTDAAVVAANWQDYAFSLMETLPTVSIAATLLPIFMALLLLRQYGKLENYNQLKISRLSS